MKTIKIGCVGDSRRIRQVLIHRSRPFIQPAPDVPRGSARLDIIRRRAEFTGQGEAGLLQLSGPVQEGRQRRDIGRSARRLW